MVRVGESRDGRSGCAAAASRAAASETYLALLAALALELAAAWKFLMYMTTSQRSSELIASPYDGIQTPPLRM
jgi:hypothetical protein